MESASPCMHAHMVFSHSADKDIEFNRTVLLRNVHEQIFPSSSMMQQQHQILAKLSC